MPDDLFAKAKSMFPTVPDDELNRGIQAFKSSMPAASDDDLLSRAKSLIGAKADGTLDKQIVTNELKSKYNIADYSPEKRQELVEATADTGNPYAAALAGFGAGVRGGDVTSGVNNVLQAGQAAARSKLDAFDKNRTLGMQNQEFQQEQDKIARESDPNSIESKTAQDLAISLGMAPDQAKMLTAAKFKDFSPALQKKYELAQRNEELKERRADRGERAEDRKLARDQMREQKELARSDKLEQAAKLSDTQVEKVAQFDNTMQEAQNALSALGNKSDWVGPIDGRTPDLLSPSDQVAFRANVGRMSDAYRHLITGAGAGNAELARLATRLPEATDTFNDFVAKSNDFIKGIQNAKGSLLDVYSQSGKKVDEFRDPAMAANTSSTPKMVTVKQNGRTFQVPADSVPSQVAQGK